MNWQHINQARAMTDHDHALDHPKRPDLAEAIRAMALRTRKPAARAEVSLQPGCAYGAVQAQRVADLERQVQDLAGRVNTLLFAIGGAVIVQVLLAIIK